MIRANFFLSFFLLSFSAFANEGRHLSLDRIVEQAKKANEQLALSKAAIHKAEERKKEIKSGALPHFSFESTLSNYLEKPSFDGFTLNRDHEFSNSVNLSQALYNFGALSSGLKAANAGIKAAQLQSESLEKEVEYLAKVNFYSVLYAKKQLEIAQESLKNARGNLKILQDYFGAGRPPQTDIIKLQADIANRKPQVVEAEGQLKEVYLQLKRLIGVKADEEVNVVGELNEKYFSSDLSGVDDETVDSTPQIKALKQQVILAKERAEAEWSSTMPLIGVFYTYQNTQRSNESLFGNGDNLNTSVYGLSIRWDIWDGGGNRARYKQALIDKSESDLQLRKGKNDLLLSLRQKISKYEQLSKSVKINKDAVSLSKQSFQLNQRKFRSGKSSVTAVNDSELVLTQSKLRELANVFQLLETKAYIEKYISYKSE